MSPTPSTSKQNADAQEAAARSLIAGGLPPVINDYTREQFLRQAKQGKQHIVAAYLALGMPVDVRDEYNQGTPLFRAVEGDHPDLVRFLVDAGADLEARDKDDDTPLMTAVNWGSLKSLRTLIELGADVNATSRRNGTPLMSAVEKEKLKLLGVLIRAGADVNQTYGEVRLTALTLAARDGKLDYVARLVKAGADVNARSGQHDRPLLTTAVIPGHLEVVQALVDAGADVDAADGLGWTPWRMATYLGHAEIAGLLAAAGAATPPTPGHDLLQAAQTDDVEGIETALAAGVEVDTPDPDGDTALALACYKGRPTAVAALLEAGAGLEPRVEGNWSPLMYAVNAQSAECVEMLLAAGAQPTHGTYGSPLVKAAQKGNPDLVRTLIDAGADLDAGDGKGLTALMWAAGRGNVEILDMLIEAGADLDVQSHSGNTALLLAVDNKQPQAVARLIEAGADLDLTNNLGQTALYQACFWGRVELMRMLLEAGADPAPRTTTGGTALAEAYGKKDKNDAFDRMVDFLTRRAYEETWAELGLDKNDDPSERFYRQLATRHAEVALPEWARQGRTDVVAGLLRAGVSPDVHGIYGKTPLMVVAREGDTATMEVLLEAGADVHAVSQYESTPLHQAAYGGHLQAIGLLLMAGADPNRPDHWQQTPVHAAAEKGHVAALALLHASGGSLRPALAGETPLMRAARFNHSQAVRWIGERIPADTRNVEGHTALALAVAQRNPETVSHLLAAGADPDVPDAAGRTPLMQAAEAGLEEIVRALLEAGANPALADAEGRTALDLAAHRPLIAALLSDALGVEPPTRPWRPVQLPPGPPLHRAARHGDLDGVRALLAAGAEVDARDARGATPLMAAAERGHTPLVAALLEAGADARAQSQTGEDAWTLAATFGHEETQEALKRAGAPVDVNRMAEHMMRLEELAAGLREGSVPRVRALLESGTAGVDTLLGSRQTSLIMAAYRGDEMMARLLIEAGADLELPNLDGWTPLMAAAQINHPQLAALLLEAGAGVDTAAPNGVTALLLAAGEGNTGCAGLLLAAGADAGRADAGGVTPLMQAAAAGSVELVHLLLDHGADPHRRDDRGLRAAEWAELHEHLHLLPLLQHDSEEAKVKTTIDDEIREMAEHFVRQRVAMGFHDADEIHGMALDYLDGECEFDVLEPYLGQLTRELMAEHCEAQASWPAETDYDRLDRAFGALEQEYNVVARHNFTCCQSCGHGEIWAEIREAQEHGPVIGYTFYHEQDTESAVDGGYLYLAYGAVEDGEEATREVANRIVQALEEAGLGVEWSGDLRQRILIPDLDWKKRREDCRPDDESSG